MVKNVPSKAFGRIISEKDISFVKINKGNKRKWFITTVRSFMKDFFESLVFLTISDILLQTEPRKRLRNETMNLYFF